VVLSDSGKTAWRAPTDFTYLDSGSGLLHLEDTVPAILDVSGTVTGILLQVPKPALVNVGGEMVDSGCRAQNLRPEDVTSVSVSGGIRMAFSRLPELSVSGPGKFKITAASMDLGLSGGIRSLGIVSAAQGAFTPRGSDIEILLTGDLNCVGSSVVSRYGGNIGLQVGGAAIIGLPNFTGDDSWPRGIVSLWAGNIELVAGGDVWIPGARIAAFDGGSIHVVSLHGNVEAGSGGAGLVWLERPYLDPATGVVSLPGFGLPLTGIIATSLPPGVPGGSGLPPGDIVVETPNGDIRAASGGVSQLNFSSDRGAGSRIRLRAGSLNPDGSVAHAGNILAAAEGVVGLQLELWATGDVSGGFVSGGGTSVSGGGDWLVAQAGAPSVTALRGGDATLEVVAQGPFPIQYQWSKDGSDLPGATNAVLVLSGVQSSDAGSYRVLVPSPSASVLVDIDVSVRPPLTLTASLAADGEHTRITVEAADGAPVQAFEVSDVLLESSEELDVWVPTGADIESDGAGRFLFDPGRSSTGNRFFRLVWRK
jgi:hypothetical protein